MPERLHAGVDIGGTKTAIVLAKDPPAIITRIAFPTMPENGPEFAISLILANLRKALLSQNLDVSDLKAIGVSCGGPLDPELGLIEEPPNLPGWKNIQITSILEQEFGVPSYLENDANAGALAEHRFGSGQGASNLIYLTMGTGIGAGLILNGNLYRGATYMAGEIGHVRLSDSGPVGYNKAGSVEGWASGSGIAKLARNAVENAGQTGERTILADVAEDGHLEIGLSAREVWHAAQGGDSLALEVVTTAGKMLGRAAAILVDLFNPEVIAIGGLALRMGDTLLGPARAIVDEEAHPLSAKACRIVPAALGEQVGDVAAICVAIEGDAHGHK